MRKRFSVILIFMAFVFTMSLLSFNTKVNAFANESDKEIFTNSKSAYLCDFNTGTVVYQKNETEKYPIASMCKIMTLLLSFEQIDDGNLSLDDTVIVSSNASGMGGSQVFLENGGEYKVSELIKSITVASANDASVAMAEKICGSEQAFVDKMNEKCKQLGMENTCFTNCTGLPKEGQFSCAKDVAKMFSELITHKDYFTFSNIWMDEVKHPEGRVTEISNTNKLIRFYNGCDAGKTGYTKEAGHCLCATALRNGLRLVSVIISAPDSKTRFSEASSMFNYGFGNYENKLILDESKELDKTVSVINGKQDFVNVKVEKSVYLFSKKGSKKSVEIVFNPESELKAPVKKGDNVGSISVYENGKEISKINVIACNDVEKASYFDKISDISDNWVI